MSRRAFAGRSHIVVTVVAVVVAIVATAVVTTMLGTEDTPSPAKSEPGAYTKWFVAQALDRYERDGRQATLDYFNAPESVDGEWYVFIADETGEVISHPTVPTNVGENLYGPLGTDATERDFGSEIMAATETGKWVDYIYLNPATGLEGVKHTWVVKQDDYIFGSGWYEEGSG